MTTTPTDSERREFGGSSKKYFNHHAFYVGYNVDNIFYSANEGSKGGLGVCPQKIFSQLQSLECLRMPLCKHHLSSVRKLRFIIFEKERHKKKPNDQDSKLWVGKGWQDR